eukprot:1253240-Amphidinium_carterae.2
MIRTTSAQPTTTSTFYVHFSHHNQLYMLYLLHSSSTRCSSPRAQQADPRVALHLYLLNNQITVLNRHTISTSTSARPSRSTSSHDFLVQLAQRWPSALIIVTVPQAYSVTHVDGMASAELLG